MSSMVVWKDSTRRVVVEWNSDLPTWTVSVDGERTGPMKGYARQIRAVEAARRRAKALLATNAVTKAS